MRRKAIGKSRATMFFLVALFLGIVMRPARAFAQETQSSSPQDQQPSAQQPTTEQPATQPPPAAKSPQKSSQPGLTEKEQQNVQHENEKGTSKDRILWT